MVVESMDRSDRVIKKRIDLDSPEQGALGIP